MSGVPRTRRMGVYESRSTSRVRTRLLRRLHRALASTSLNVSDVSRQRALTSSITSRALVQRLALVVLRSLFQVETPPSPHANAEQKLPLTLVARTPARRRKHEISFVRITNARISTERARHRRVPRVARSRVRIRARRTRRLAPNPREICHAPARARARRARTLPHPFAASHRGRVCTTRVTPVTSTRHSRCAARTRSGRLSKRCALARPRARPRRVRVRHRARKD